MLSDARNDYYSAVHVTRFYGHAEQAAQQLSIPLRLSSTHAQKFLQIPGLRARVDYLAVLLFPLTEACFHIRNSDLIKSERKPLLPVEAGDVEADDFATLMRQSEARVTL